LHAYLAFLGGFIIGLLFGVGMMVVFGSGRKTRIPFAPALAIGAVIGVFWGAGLAQTLFHASS
jgi:prepilin signal peptidase PulO-like enzyme (type II secretory pathway)